MIKDLDFKLESTWLEDGTNDFKRVVILNYHFKKYDAEDSDFRPKALKGMIEEKLEDELGFVLGRNYVFGSKNDFDQLHQDLQSKELLRLTIEVNSLVIRLKDEEDYTMLKLHYQ